MKGFIWSYPWDIAGAGVNTFLDQVAQANLSGVSVAAAYHAGLFVTPHHPEHRLRFLEDGVVYFRPHLDRFTGPIKPKVSRMLKKGDPLRELVDEAAGRGTSITAWMVCNHNSALGMRHPEVVVRNAYGDPLYYAPCPSHPVFTDYICTLAGDMSSSYQIDAVDAESLNYLSFPHGYHHEKDLVGLSREAGLLLSICFCSACADKARAQGIDVARVRRLVKARLENLLKNAPGPEEAQADLTGGLDEWAGDPELAAYFRLRQQTVTSLVKGVKASLRADCRLRVIVTQTPECWWESGFSQPALAAADEVIMCCYNPDPQVVYQAMHKVREVLPANVALTAGLQAGHPTCVSQEDVKAQVEAARRSGADCCQFYNYGLMPLNRLDWIRNALGQ